MNRLFVYILVLLNSSVLFSQKELTHDVYFNTGSGHRWHCLGFANRPYTTQECLDLVDYLDDRYVNN